MKVDYSETLLLTHKSDTWLRFNDRAMSEFLYIYRIKASSGECRLL